MTIGVFTQMALVDTYVGDDGFTRVRESFRITPSFGTVYYQSVDFGFPEVRASVQENPQSDGTYDETQYLGARSVALSGIAEQNAFGDEPSRSGWNPGVAWNSASWFTRYLSAWASPARRFRLYFTDDSGLPRFMDVRGDSFSAPVEKSSAHYRSWQLGLVNPSGKIYSFSTDPEASADGRNRVLIRQSTVNQAGRSYPEVGPYVRNYPAPLGRTTIDYTGTVANGFVANVHSNSLPMVDPRITVRSPDGVVQSIGITGYTLPPNAVVTFNMIERTITTSDGTSLDQFKTAPLQWPQLRPGTAVGQVKGSNSIGFSIASGATDAYVEVLYYNADLA